MNDGHDKMTYEGSSTRLEGCLTLAAAVGAGVWAGYLVHDGHPLVGLWVFLVAVMMFLFGLVLLEVPGVVADDPDEAFRFYGDPTVASPLRRGETDEQGRVVVTNQHWRGAVVKLDGYRFVRCRFDGCTLVTAEHDWVLEDCVAGVGTTFARPEDAGTRR